MKDPKTFLTTALSILKPGGVLYIETPNSSSHLTAIEKENYTFLTPPDHLNLFSEKSFRKMLENCNGTLDVSYQTYSYPEHLVGMLRTVKNIGSHKSGSKDGKFVGDLNREVPATTRLPFFDRVVAPLLTPLLNIGNRGSFLQVFIQKMN